MGIERADDKPAAMQEHQRRQRGIARWAVYPYADGLAVQVHHSVRDGSKVDDRLVPPRPLSLIGGAHVCDAVTRIRRQRSTYAQRFGNTGSKAIRRQGREPL